MNSHDDEIENLLHEWGAWARNGFKLERGHSIAYEMTQIAPCDKAKIAANDGIQVRLQNRRAALMIQHADCKDRDRIVNQAIASEVEIHRMYKPTQVAQTRSRKVNIPTNRKLENVDRILSMMNDRFKQTLYVCYIFNPSIGRKMQSSKLGLSESGLTKRLSAIKNHMQFQLSL